MIIFITGASHTGKTALAQKLLEKYQYPYLSIDHLKMGLIRSGNTELTPMSKDEDLTAYLWPIVREMAKTAIENKQNLIVEGCYIPFDWKKDFEQEYLDSIEYYCLVMSENYIRKHFADIKSYANVIESCHGRVFLFASISVVICDVNGNFSVVVAKSFENRFGTTCVYALANICRVVRIAKDIIGNHGEQGVVR